MNDVLQQGDINTTSCKVRHNQELYMLSSECDQALLTCALIHSTIDIYTLETCLCQQFVEVLNVVTSCRKNYSLLLSFNVFV